MPTRNAIALEVRENLDDAGVTFYTSTDINDAIQDSYNTFAALTGNIVKSTLLVKQSSPYWNIASVVSDYLYPIGFYNLATNRWLEGKRRRYFDGLRWDWELWTGEPYFFCPVDFRRVCIVPYQPAATGNVVLIYKASPPALEDSTIPLIPKEIENILEMRTTADLLEQAKEFSKAQSYWAEWQKKLLKAKTIVHNPSQADRAYVLQPYIQMPQFGPAS